jgi:hypothetical protein
MGGKWDLTRSLTTARGQQAWMTEKYLRRVFFATPGAEISD